MTRIFAILFLTALLVPAFAQQTKTPVQQKIEARLGELTVENAVLSANVDDLQKQLAAKDARIKELEAKVKPE